MAPDEAAGPAFRFEPLQVCDQGDPFLGSVAGIPFLAAVAPAVVLVPELSRIAAEAGFPLPDGFDPLPDRPPQPSA